MVVMSLAFSEKKEVYFMEASEKEIVRFLELSLLLSSLMKRDRALKIETLH